MILLVATAMVVGSLYLVIQQLGFFKTGSEDLRLPADALADNSLEEMLRRKDALFGISKQAWSPISGKFKAIEQRMNVTSLRRKLIIAGSPMGVLEFLIFKAFSLIGIPVLAMIFFSAKMKPEILLPISLAMGFFLPEMWLNKKIKKRQARIRKDLPNIIDLLNLAVSGGLDFMLAVNRVVRDIKKSDVSQELAEVYSQTQMGKTRREALKNFAWRTDMPEVHSFVRTLVQADRMGTPMSDALKQQSEEMRWRRFQQGETMALKAPIKLLFPLFAFILPVILIIVGGPIMLQFTRGSMNLGF